MRFFFIFLFSLFVFKTLEAKNHPLHIALVNIEYNSQTKNFDLLFKIFIDDFEKIIYQKYGINLNSGKSNQHLQYDFFCTKYIKEHFSMAFNQSKASNDVIFKEKDYNVEAIWLKFSLKAPASIKKVTIKLTVMTDLFDDQTNLVVFKYNDFEEAFKLDNLLKSNSFEIN